MNWLRRNRLPISAALSVLASVAIAAVGLQAGGSGTSLALVVVGTIVLTVGGAEGIYQLSNWRNARIRQQITDNQIRFRERQRRRL